MSIPLDALDVVAQLVAYPIHMSRFRISNQVSGKLAYTPTEESQNLEFLGIGRGGIVTTKELIRGVVWVRPRVTEIKIWGLGL